jgi:hypothetical protein
VPTKITNLLKDHLLGRLRTDAADRHRVDRLFNVVIDFDVGNLLQRFEVQDFGVGQLQTGLVRHHVPAAEGFVLAAVAVDRHTHVDLAAVQLLRGRCKRGFDGREHHLEVNTLLTRDGVYKIKQIAVH